MLSRDYPKCNPILLRWPGLGWRERLKKYCPPPFILISISVWVAGGLSNTSSSTKAEQVFINQYFLPFNIQHIHSDMEIMLWGSAGTGLRLLMVPQFARSTTTLTFNEKAILMNLLVLLLSSEEIQESSGCPMTGLVPEDVTHPFSG